MAAESLSWLPPDSPWCTATALEALPKGPDPAAWDILVKLAQYQLDLVATILRKLYPVLPTGLSTRPVRLAVLGFATLGYLLPGIRVGALRRARTCP